MTMSFSSGEVFETPQRPADFVLPYGYFDPDLPKTEEVTRKIWMPTDTEPGQYRIQVVTSAGNHDNRIERHNFLDLEEVAAAGMRRVFERFDLRSFHTCQQDTQNHDAPADIREAAIAFPSSARHAELVNDFADSSRGQTKYRIKAWEDSYEGIELLTELDANRLIMSTTGEVLDPLVDDGGTYDLQFFAHDLLVHFPAWLCLPRDISTRIRRRATDMVRSYSCAQESHSLARVEAAEGQVNRLGMLLDQTVNIWNMRGLLDGSNDTYDDKMSEILQYQSPRYSVTTREHIANPREDEVLMSRWGY
jgi:hypothetical protein